MQMTISINPALEEQLSRLSALTKCGQAQLLEELISNGLAEKLERLAAIQEGLDDMAAGRTLAHEEVKAKAQTAIRRGAAKQS
ncbi:MAG: hypothetical protein LBS31_06790 [Candidatus Adiutrix sp.]|nr:hypothetical protein [Candidatus Adiutrix sp.]